MYDECEHALIVRRAGAPRLAIVFSGIGQRMQGVGPLEFLKASGLEDSNFVFLRDLRRTGFAYGCSAAIPTFDALLGWLQTAVASFSRVEDILAIGVSSGALPSMAAAEFLDARCSIVFGPRFQAMKEVAAIFGRRDRAVIDNAALFERGADVRLRLRDRIQTASHTALEAVRQRFGMPPREWSPAPLLEAGVQDSAPFFKHLRTDGSTRHHLFYIPSNMRDRGCVKALTDRALRVIAHPVEPPTGYPRTRFRWDHDVVPILIAAGSLNHVIASAIEDSPCTTVPLP